MDDKLTNVGFPERKVRCPWRELEIPSLRLRNGILESISREIYCLHTGEGEKERKGRKRDKEGKGK